jgi:hypothetical protein
MPIPLLAIALGASLVKGIIGGVTAGQQASEARQMEAENARPVETVPQGVQDATQIAKLMSFLGMPAQQYVAAMRDIQRGGTNALAAARDRRGGLDIAGTVQQQSSDATLNLNAKSAEMRTENLVRYIQQLGVEGEWQDKVWNWNAAQKFQENAAAIRALKTASAANTNTAMNSVLSGILTYATGGLGGVGKAAAGATADATATDPTITNPDMFDNPQVGQLINYLSKLQLQ